MIELLIPGAVAAIVTLWTSLEIEDYLFATSQLAQTTLRSVVGQAELDELDIGIDPVLEGKTEEPSLPGSPVQELNPGRREKAPAESQDDESS